MSSKFLFLNPIKVDDFTIVDRSDEVCVFKMSNIIDKKKYSTTAILETNNMEYTLDGDIDEECKKFLIKDYLTYIPQKVFCKIIKVERGLESTIKRWITPELRFYDKVGSVPYIPEFYGLYAEPNSEDKIYIMTEYCNLGDLSDYLKSGTDAKSMVEIARNIAEALLSVHSKGLIHCDVKFDNICLSRNSDGSLIVKLIDFGSSKSLGSKIGFCGTPKYMAPELIELKIDGGGMNCTPTVDVWSYGVLIYKLLVNEFPFALDRIDMDSLKQFYRKQKSGIDIKILKAKVEAIFGDESEILYPLLIVVRKTIVFDPEDRATFRTIIKLLK